MRNYLSPKAGLLAVATATGFELEEIETGEMSTIGPRQISYYFAGCDDVAEVAAKSRASLRETARTAWAADRALALLLFMFDPAELNDEFDELAAQAEEFLHQSQAVATVLEGRLYSSALPEPIAFGEIMARLKDYPRTAAVISAFIELQPDIDHVRQAFDQIPASLFADGDRHTFRKAALQRGAFRDLVLEAHGGKGIDGATFSLLKKLSDQENFRAIVATWTETFKRTPRIARDWALFRDGRVATLAPGLARNRHRSYERAMNQQRAIIARLKAGDRDTARAFARDLVEQQRRESEPEHLAMSLTSLSKAARATRDYDLSIDWAYQAVQSMPDDPRAHGQFATLLIDTGRYVEALDELAAVEAFGSRGFARTQRAGILRAQHRFDDALEAYQTALAESAGTEDEPYDLAGVAEVLRDLGRMDEAADAYRAAVATYPDNLALLNGYAATLAELGEVDDAFEVYGRSIDLGDDVVTRNGVATLLKHVGEFAQAEARFREIVLDVPYDLVARIGLADTMFVNGKLDEGLALARETLDRFRRDADAYEAFGSMLARHGDVRGAVRTLEDGIREAGPTPRFFRLLASAERSRGAYEVALQVLDRGVAAFPHDTGLEAARAGMLRRLGRLGAAAEVYDRILARSPSLRSARNAKASILIYRGEFATARELLEVARPRTSGDWRAMLLLSHLDLRTGQGAAAERRLEGAYHVVPFERERRAIGAALASIRIERSQFAEAADYVAGDRFDITHVIRFHALAGAGAEEPALRLYKAMNDNAPEFYYRELGHEVAVQAGLIPGQAAHDYQWLLREERDGLLLEAA